MAEELESILSGDDAAPEQASSEVPTETSTGEQEAAQEPTEAPQEPTQEDATPASEDGEDQSESQQVPLSALQDERRKRQELERQLSEGQKQQQESQQQPQEEEAELPDPVDDPKGYQQAVERRIEQRELNNRLNMSEMMAREVYDDLDQRVEEFREMAQEYPGVVQQVQNATHPYKEMAQLVEKRREYQAMQNADSYREQIRQEEREKLRKEMEQEQQADQAKQEASSKMPSLADKRDASSAQAPTSEALEDLLGR